MKKILSIAAAVTLVAAIASPAAQAHDNDAAATALGFFLGAMVTSPQVAYSAPPPVVYRSRTRVFVPAPREREHRDYRPRQRFYGDRRDEAPRHRFYGDQHGDGRHWQGEAHRRDAHPIGHRGWRHDRGD